MNLNDTKSSEQLRKEVSQELDRLDNNIDALKDKMSPGQVIDDAIFRRFRGDPKSSIKYLKSNPVGTSFLALGTLLLMDNDGESYEQYLKNQSRQAYNEYRGKVEEGRDRLGAQVGEISREMKGRAQNLMNRGEEKLQNIKEKVSRGGFKDNVIDATDSFKERAKQVRSDVEENISLSSSDLEVGPEVSRLRQKVGEYGKNVSQKFKENGYDSLAYLSIGLGTGFATGSLIPLSEESTGIDIGFDFSRLRGELESAVNESVNVFKDGVIEGLKNSDVNIF